MNKKVSKIEFHICYDEMNDCIVRMADLIKEGYTVEAIAHDPRFALETLGRYSEPSIHITLQKENFK